MIWLGLAIGFLGFPLTWFVAEVSYDLWKSWRH